MMHQGFACAQPARYLPASHAAHRRLQGSSCLPATSENVGPMKQDFSSGVCLAGAQVPSGKHLVGGQAVHRQRAGGSKALGWASPGEHLFLFFDRRENLREKYGWKIVIDVHGRRRVHSLLGFCWLSLKRGELFYIIIIICKQTCFSRDAVGIISTNYGGHRNFLIAHKSRNDENTRLSSW